MKVLKIRDFAGDAYRLKEIKVYVELGHWFWRKRKTYVGSGAVWHEYSTGERAGIITESQLSAVWQTEMWARKSWRDRENRRFDVLE